MQTRRRHFAEFLEPRSDSGYDALIQDMIAEGRTRLVVNLYDLRQFKPLSVSEQDRGLEAKLLLDRPMDCLPAYESALQQYIKELHQNDPSSKAVIAQKYHVAIEGSFGSNRMSPRELMSDNLTQLCCVEGIVTKCSLVRPKVMRTVHHCAKTGEFHSKVYHDATSFGQRTTDNSFPRTDDEGNPLTMEYGLCEYKNSQKVYIQDMPERTAAGTMPRTIECIVEDDTVDNCKPGDRVQMIGVYRALAGRAQGEASGRFRTVLIVNNVRRIGRDEKKMGVSQQDIHNFKQLRSNHKKDLFDIVSRSLAPTIYGHDYIKKAVTLMLLGGVEKNLDNGTHIRGDINILMVGDPSTAKSQLLRAVMQAGELVINTTGRGSSGVGLTAAVTMDKDSGERRLEAGAMVLADRGIVCIDEFDKMSDVDRTAIHEVMEQQTVTIAKAGIHTSLNARCSVIAASNPIYGQYSRSMTPAQNIALPDSLLSRFDLLFIVLDKLDPRIDRAISDHVLRMHRYQGKETDVFEESDEEGDEEETEMYEKRDKLLQGAAAALRKGGKKMKFLTSDFVRKYIRYAKEKAQMSPPRLTDEARELIAQKYSELRLEDNTQTLPITARCLETLIRLASAHAKLRVSSKIEVVDVEAVYRVLGFALTNDAAPQDDDDSINSKQEMEMEDELEGAADDMEMDEEPSQLPRRRSKQKRKKPMDHETPAKIKAAKPAAGVRSARSLSFGGVEQQKKTAITKFLAGHWRSTRASSVTLKNFIKAVKKDANFSDYTAKSIERIVEALSADENPKVFLTNGEMYKI